MFLSFHVVHYMQAVDEGKISFYLAVIRQLCLNIPILFLLNAIFGMQGIIWTQVSADIMNVIISYLIYARVMKKSKFVFE
jgi:Na+-driven multidrug efflux pump